MPRPELCGRSRPAGAGVAPSRSCDRCAPPSSGWRATNGCSRPSRRGRSPARGAPFHAGRDGRGRLRAPLSACETKASASSSPVSARTSRRLDEADDVGDALPAVLERDAVPGAPPRPHRDLGQAHPARPRPGRLTAASSAATAIAERCAAHGTLVLDRHGGLGPHRGHGPPGRDPHGAPPERRHRAAGLPPAHRRGHPAPPAASGRPSGSSRAPTTSPAPSAIARLPRSTPTSWPWP